VALRHSSGEIQETRERSNGWIWYSSGCARGRNEADTQISDLKNGMTDGGVTRRKNRGPEQ
jgi:hypothetical protein